MDNNDSECMIKMLSTLNAKMKSPLELPIVSQKGNWVFSPAQAIVCLYKTEGLLSTTLYPKPLTQAPVFSHCNRPRTWFP